jgi:hypothetical protein
VSKLAHSNDETMAQIERDAARDEGNLRRCSVCGAEGIVDNPDCPLDGVHCEFYTVPPTVGPDPS